MILANTVRVGSDAEMPVKLVTGDFIPVTGMVGGTKAEPLPLDDGGYDVKGFAVQEDGVNLEFNIPPAASADKFCMYIMHAMQESRKCLPPSMEAVIEDHMEYRPEFLLVPGASALGCSPDYNVYTQAENPRPNAKNPLLRTAAAHVHVGWKNPTNEDREAMVKALDLFLGVAFHRHDSAARREMYGRAGSFRPKAYGLEYRTLGNAWLRGDRPYAVFNGVMQAVAFVNRGGKFTKEQEDLMQRVINTATSTSDDRLIVRSLGATVQ